MPTFEVQIKKTQRADHPNSVTFPKKDGAFVLVFNDNWNDYGYYTSFALWEFSTGEKRLIGELKIINKSENVTYSLIKDGFNSLDENFCSLGQDVGFYINLKKLLSNAECKNVLRSLRDCAFDKRIFEDFKGKDMMKWSLLRESYATRAFDEAPLIISGLKPEEAFSFTYCWNIPFLNNISLDWNVHFDYEAAPFKRCIGIIGENGVGKTRMLSNFTLDYFKPDSDSFSRKPLFSGIIVVNSTKHDHYPCEREISNFLNADNSRFNLSYRQLSLDDFEDVNIIVDTIGSLSGKPTLHKESILAWYRRTLITCISPSLDDLFELKIETETRTSWDGSAYDSESRFWLPKDPEYLKTRIRIMSSGELYSLALITFLYANIHISSLVILDEPETHLHPSVMVSIMKCLYEVLERYDSYAIIATHSPLIIREIVKQNVFRIKRMDNEIPTISRVAFDTFGEDIASLYQNIFEYDERNSIFTKFVKSIVNTNRLESTNEVVEIISDDNKVNLNARMRITQIIDEIYDAQSKS